MKDIADWIGVLNNNAHSWTETIQRIRLEAYRQGCTDAASVELGRNAKGHSNTCLCMYCDYRGAILVLRDSKKLEDM